MTSSGDPTSNARLHIQVPMGDQRCHDTCVASTYIEVENLELIKISPFLSNKNRWQLAAFKVAKYSAARLF